MENRLTDEDMTRLLPLLDKVNPLPFMQYPIIKKIWERRLVPLNPMELMLIQQDPFTTPVLNLRVLLRHRNDEFFSDCFHFPGGFLGSNELVEETIERVAKKEVGVGIKKVWFVSQANFPKLGRDHEYSTIFFCQLAGEPITKPDVTIFTPLGALPENLLPHHVDMANRAKEWLYTMQSLPTEVRNRILATTSIVESTSER